MKRLLSICILVLPAVAASPAFAGSIGTYSGCKSLSGSSKQSCLDCVGGGNFWQTSSNSCGLPGVKPAAPVTTGGSSPAPQAPKPLPIPKPVLVPQVEPPTPPPPLPPPPPPPTSRASKSNDDTEVKSSRCSIGVVGEGAGHASLVGLAVVGLALVRRRSGQGRKASTDSP